MRLFRFFHQRFSQKFSPKFRYGRAPFRVQSGEQTDEPRINVCTALCTHLSVCCPYTSGLFIYIYMCFYAFSLYLYFYMEREGERERESWRENTQGLDTPAKPGRREKERERERDRERESERERERELYFRPGTRPQPRAAENQAHAIPCKDGARCTE